MSDGFTDKIWVSGEGASNADRRDDEDEVVAAVLRRLSCAVMA